MESLIKVYKESMVKFYAVTKGRELKMGKEVKEERRKRKGQ